MSSPAGSQIHPSSTGNREGSSLMEKAKAADGSLKPHDIPNNKAWQESGRNGSSLGRTVALRVSAFTGGFSSEDDSDCEGVGDLNSSRGMTRSLGRKEITSVFSTGGFRGQSNIVPVSERSAAYKELISSQNAWLKPSPKHSAVKVSDGSDTSPVRTRIEQNPFLQLDKRGKIQPSSPAHTSTANSSVAHAPSSPTISGMSVQMRIKMWAEKEQGSRTAHNKLAHRRSLQMSSLLAVNNGEEDGEMGGGKKKPEYTAQSDDETIMNKSSSSMSGSYSRSTRENVYEVISDKMEECRVKEASSSSSETSTPNKSPKNKRKDKKSSSKRKKNSKVDSPDLNQKRSKWKIKSPLQKRKKSKVKKESKDETEEGPEEISTRPRRLSRKDVKKRKLTVGSSREEDVADDVFNSEKVDLEQTLESEANIAEREANIAEREANIAESESNLPDVDGEHPGELPSVFDMVDTPPQPRPTKESRSISREIFSIIDSLGTISERTKDSSITIPAVTLLRSNSEGESESGSDDEEEEDDNTAQSSLDIQNPALRRASEGQNIRRRVNHSNSSDKRGRKSSVPAVEQNAESLIATALMYADAVWDRQAVDQDELSFRVGDVIEILDMTDDIWWHGSVGSSSGWFPSTFVRLRVGQEPESDDSGSGEGSTNKIPESNEEGSVQSKEPGASTTSESVALEQLQRLSNPTPPPSSSENSDKPSATLPRNFPRQQGATTRRRMTIRRKDPSSSSLPVKLTPQQVRAKIVEEILSTEQDYVKHLEDIIEGYLKRCLEYNTLFDEERIEVIFSNVDKLYDFQKDFLRELEARIKPGHMAEAEIGEVFVINQHEFNVYSQYCNNHPHAVSEMSSLQENEQYCFFFESCRLLRNLQDISLEGFLLTPVQKICKYPLQLSELLKYTSEEHPDHPHVVAAQKAMKDVAMLINEQKRRIENMGKIGCWQRTIEGWKGPDVLETSTEMVHSGELHKISKGHSQERHFFLFDHQLVYCKKDTIGGRLCYKGRVDLDHCLIADITDSSVLHGNTPVKNCWRMNNKAKDNKWYIIYAKTPQLKDEWMKAFERERERVREDEEKGFHVSMKMKRAAVALCANDSGDHRRRGKSVKKVAFSESVDGVAVNKKHAMTVSGSISSSQVVKKTKTAKRKLNSVSGTSSAKVIF